MFESKEGPRRSRGWYVVGFMAMVLALLAGPLVRAVNHLLGKTVAWTFPGLMMGLLTWIAYLRAKRARGRMVRVLGLVDDVEVVASWTNEEGVESVYRRVNVRFQESEDSTTLDCWFDTEDNDHAVGDSVSVFERGRAMNLPISLTVGERVTPADILHYPMTLPRGSLDDGDHLVRSRHSVTW